ncbi:MAG: phosphoribosylglycinamide formyltransferase [Oscillospiraceae bacterium]|nr:phosphoribosylglycinamide formyltransferase [Oscillospiraceae bacterium]
MVKTAVLVSGGGTNLQAIIDAHLFAEIPNCELTAVISSDPEAYALIRAKSANIPAYVVDRSLFPNAASYNTAIGQKLEDLDIELVALAGYIHPLSQGVLKQYENHIINVFPSLLPAFSQCNGASMEPYEQALRAGVKLSGATAYFVTAETAGPIIMQQAVEVWEGDTPKTLQRRIMEEAEWKLLPKALAMYCQGYLRVEDGVVHIAGENK